MPRIRTVKPEMAQDEDLALCAFAAQLLAVRILCHCDDEGYFKADPRLVKANCFPLIDVDSVTVHGYLNELSKIGYLRLTEGSDGKKYGQVTKFTKHQKVNRPSPSAIKELVTFTEDSVSPHGTLTEDSPPEGKGSGKEGNGKERNGSVGAERFFVPLKNGAKFEVDDELRATLKSAYPLVDIEAELNRLIAWNASNLDKRKTKTGVRRHINTWMRKEQERKVEKQGRPSTSPAADLSGQEYGEAGAI